MAVKLPAAPSQAAERFARDVRALLKVRFMREFEFAKPRKWRADFAFVDDDANLLVEIDGITREGGRHQRFHGFTNDAEKLNAATLLGYRVLRFTPRHVRSGYAIETTAQALGIAIPSLRAYR